jgi:hypothetical protein
MSGYEYAFTLTPGGASRARSLTITCVAIAAVCVLSSTVVMRELVGPQPARASAAATPSTATTASTVGTPTAARTWALQPRWWPGEIRQTQTVRAAATVPDSELTFAKGYQLRLAARQATAPTAQPASAPAQVIAAEPATETKSSRTAGPVRKAPTVAPTANPLARFDVGTRALAYDEQRPSERGLADIRRTPPRGLFGTLY